MAGKLTTHVLDTARGIPAAGVRYTLLRCEPDHSGERCLVTSGITNVDGRSPEPMLENDKLFAGYYALDFDVAAYFQQSGQMPVDPFLDVVTIAFRITSILAFGIAP